MRCSHGEVLGPSSSTLAMLDSRVWLVHKGSDLQLLNPSAQGNVLETLSKIAMQGNDQAAERLMIVVWVHVHGEKLPLVAI